MLVMLRGCVPVVTYQVHLPDPLPLLTPVCPSSDARKGLL